MRLVKSELPATTVVSVGQRPEAEAFHDRCLRLVRAEGGARLVGHTAAVPLRVSA
jgi:vitamin B12/bleomycin/antimicrobial peptide transport system ATP-binding/permease protein